MRPRLRPGLLPVWTFVLALIGGAADAQHHPRMLPAEPSPVSLTPEQQTAIRSALRDQFDTWECDLDGRDAKWAEDLQFKKIPLHPGLLTILVEADTGCTRAGVGINGAMWIVALEGGVPKILASPKHQFNGFFQTVAATATNGYRDLTIAWSSGPTEENITYFHFDGRIYRSAGKATLYSDDPEHGSKYVPEPAPRKQQRRRAASRSRDGLEDVPCPPSPQKAVSTEQ